MTCHFEYYRISSLCALEWTRRLDADFSVLFVNAQEWVVKFVVQFAVFLRLGNKMTQFSNKLNFVLILVPKNLDDPKIIYFLSLLEQLILEKKPKL